MENSTLKNFLTKIQNYWKDFIESLKKGGKDGKKMEMSIGINRQSYLVALGLCCLAFLIFLVGLGFIWFKNSNLTNRVRDLKNLSSYDLNSFFQSDLMTEDKGYLPQNLDQIIETHRLSKAEKERVEGELNFKKSVYTEFLRNLLLPSLNIWKDPYTKEVDISILGKKYLDINPYQDIALISQWSSIIRDSGKDVGDNQVVNIKIGDIKELENGLFNIPITISFKSDSKRAFLLLVDKLSLTSNINNLGLLNDFSYYLFNAIRDLKPDEIQNLVGEYELEKPIDQDEKTFYNAVISRNLYNWISAKDAMSPLIDEEVIDKAIKQSVVCGQDEPTDICYFRFRDKYRTIPGLAYGVGLDSLVNKSLALKQFLAEIPPLIAIDSFTFDKARAQGFSLSDNNEYLGNVSFSIYGRGILPHEAQEISQKLTESCFGSGSKEVLDLSGALAPVQHALEQVGSIPQANVERMANLLELKDILLEETKTYDSLSPYNKMIKKFEFYRMLKNVGLCTK